jgi:hypothetical protein
VNASHVGTLIFHVITSRNKAILLSNDWNELAYSPWADNRQDTPRANEALPGGARLAPNGSASEALIRRTLLPAFRGGVQESASEGKQK